MLPVFVFYIILYSGFRFSTLRPVHRARFSVRGPYTSRGRVRFRTPPGCEGNMRLVLGLEKPTFVRLELWWYQRACARLLSRCDFVSKPCWASRQFYFLCFTPLSSNSGTSASRATQGFGALSTGAISGSKTRRRYGSRDVKR